MIDKLIQYLIKCFTKIRREERAIDHVDAVEVEQPEAEEGRLLDARRDDGDERLRMLLSELLQHRIGISLQKHQDHRHAW